MSWPMWIAVLGLPALTLRPRDPPTLDTARTLLYNLFFNPERGLREDGGMGGA